MSVTLALFGLILLFPNFFADGYGYLKHHPYLFILVLDVFLLIMYFLSMRDFKISHSKATTVVLATIGIAAFAYAYITNFTDIPLIVVVTTMILFGLQIQNKITKRRTQ